MADLQFMIETMQASDWEQVRAIYLEGIATGNATLPARSAVRQIPHIRPYRDSPRAFKFPIRSRAISRSILEGRQAFPTHSKSGRGIY